MADPLSDLTNRGVSIWLDDLSRQRLTTDSLAGLVARDHVVGVTTNPTIFAKAIADREAYAQQIRDMWARGAAVGEALRGMTAFDVRWACDVLRPAYDASGGVDGRVSIEVDPRLAYDTEATVAEARFLWWLVDRPNLFIKIPAAYPDTRYVTDLVAPGVVNTMPEATLRAVADHGRIPEDSVRGYYAEARQVLSALEALGVDYGEVTEKLENNGLAAFDASWRELGDQLRTVLRRRPDGEEIGE
jgi:transaldolase